VHDRQDQVGPVEGVRGRCDAPGLASVQVELESHVDCSSMVRTPTPGHETSRLEPGGRCYREIPKVPRV